MPRAKQPIVKIHMYGNMQENKWQTIIDDKDIYEDNTMNEALAFAFRLTCQFQEKGYKTICTKEIK